MLYNARSSSLPCGVERSYPTINSITSMYLIIASWIVRIILRVYFIAALIFICAVGDKCLHLKARVRLLRGEDVGVTGKDPHHIQGFAPLLTGQLGMVGWLRGLEPFTATARLRALPGGWIGVLMILAGLLGIASDLSTNLISSASRGSRCDFDAGIILSAQDSSFYPSPYVNAALYSQAAQLSTSATQDLHGAFGLRGIYQAFDPLDLSFFATEDDVVGSWKCKSVSAVIQFTATSAEDVLDTLMSDDLLYEVCYPSYNSVSGQNFTQIVGLSPSSIDTQSSWNIRVAVDMLDVSNSNHMQVWQCDLSTAESSVEVIHRSIDVNYTLNAWKPFFQAGLYAGFDSDRPDVGDSTNPVASQLELLLNSIIMVAGTSNSVDVKNPGLDYGCLRSGTSVAVWIVCMVLLVLSMALFFLVYWIHLKISIFRERRRYDRVNSGHMLDSKELEASVPNCLLDWVAHAAHESRHSNERPRHHHLSKWHLSTRFHDGHNLGLVPRHRLDQVPPGHAAPVSSCPQPVAHPLQESFLRGKTGYDAVRTSEIPTYNL